MKFLGIDYGKKRIGLAICDPDEKIASPLAVLKNSPRVIQEILDCIEAENADAIVIGLPLNMDDSEGPQARLVRGFAAALKSHTNLPLYLQDERLSSFEAEEKLADAGLTIKKKQKRLDAVAAANILQAFLDGRAQKG